MDDANTLVKWSIDNTNKLLGLGWTGDPVDFCWWRNILGWLITALAISLGAPFWFDLLNKLMQLRTSKKDGTNITEAKAQTIIINPQTTSEEAVG